MLELRKLDRHFGALRVIDGLDLTVEKGSILGVLGPNGAGKTTLFNLIVGVQPPSAGNIFFNGQDITRLRPWRRCQAGIGRTYQVPKPFGHMSVFENVLVCAVSGGGKSISGAREWAREVVEFTGLARHMLSPAGTLPLLDLKRLELAKAVASQPQLLLLDEIAGGLTDPECDELLEIVTALHERGATIVWVEHVIHALRRVASDLAVLYGGRIISHGKPDAVLADRKVREVYLGMED